MGQAKGLFGGSSGSIPLSPELYAFSDIASILLLFIAGLETDIDLFIKYALKGSIVGLGRLIFSFFAA